MTVDGAGRMKHAEEETDHAAMALRCCSGKVGDGSTKRLQEWKASNALILSPT